MIRGLAAIVVGVLAAAIGVAQDPAPKTLRVLTYNIHHGRGTDNTVDLPRIAKVITAAKPDLVALQEVDDRTRRTGGVDQTAELAKLTGLHGRFGKAIDYEGGGYGQAVLSRFPLGDLKIHWLPGEPDRERRIAAEARVTIDGRNVAFVTTHLHHANREFRILQTQKLNDLFGKADHAVILAGDLNATPDEKPLTILREKFLNATAGDNLHSFPAGKPVKQIDYVLVRPSGIMRVVERKVIDEPVASDHRPVLAVLEWVK
jgi:endonuclease/exonuclease/phosphatase family metal-dependent hydrolase